MPEQSVIVRDLETVPDLAAAARMLDLGNAPEAEVRQALGAGFPKHPLHKIVCIGALVASRQPEGWRVDALGAPHVGERTEGELISAFVEKIGQRRPQLITFNGQSFDLPVLRYRAMVNRVAAGGLQVRRYFHRYTDDALDLCDALGSVASGAKVKLDEILHDDEGRELDDQAMESCEEEVGEGYGQMDRLPATVKGAESHGQEKLVVPLQLHDRIVKSAGTLLLLSG